MNMKFHAAALAAAFLVFSCGSPAAENERIPDENEITEPQDDTQQENGNDGSGDPGSGGTGSGTARTDPYDPAKKPDPGVIEEPLVVLPRPQLTVMFYVTDTTGGHYIDRIKGAAVEYAGYTPQYDNGCEGWESFNGVSVRNISEFARMDVYFPAGEPDGKMVIICPGGSYSMVADVFEGMAGAYYLNPNGTTVGVLKYRLPNKTAAEAPVEDVLNAIRYSRSKASEWHIGKIGVLGTSAGGDKADFGVLLYPVITMGEGAHSDTRTNLLGYSSKYGSADEYAAAKVYYSQEKNVSPETPVTLVMYSENDGAVLPDYNGKAFYDALTENGTGSSVHVFPGGGHGWGFGTVELRGSDNIAEWRDDFFDVLFQFISSL